MQSSTTSFVDKSIGTFFVRFAPIHPFLYPGITTTSSFPLLSVYLCFVRLAVRFHLPNWISRCLLPSFSIKPIFLPILPSPQFPLPGPLLMCLLTLLAQISIPFLIQTLQAGESFLPPLIWISSVQSAHCLFSSKAPTTLQNFKHHWRPFPSSSIYLPSLPTFTFTVIPNMLLTFFLVLHFHLPICNLLPSCLFITPTYQLFFPLPHTKSNHIQAFQVMKEMTLMLTMALPAVQPSVAFLLFHPQHCIPFHFTQLFHSIQTLLPPNLFPP